jgi:NAD(P)-dependent dehydrogenase (short-subunit alcohol dehydrogenase family)
MTKLAIVTGATNGIGKEIARGLASSGMTVVIGARDLERGAQTAKELGGTIHVLPLDVADQRSIHVFADAYRARFPRLDLLVNNAGAWFSDRRESAQGHELTFATNVLGPHLLTHLLVDSLRASRGARVVNVVSSIASGYDPTDLEYTRRNYDGFKVYAQSKQALRMLTSAQATRLGADRITVNAAAPGFVRTGFNRNAHGIRAAMIGAMAKLFAVRADKGAATPLWVATAPELDGVTGKYFDGLAEKDTKFRDAAANLELDRLCTAMMGAGA